MYTSKEVAEKVGLNKTSLDQWLQRGVARPKIRVRGKGRSCVWDDRNISIIKLTKKLNELFEISLTVAADISEIVIDSSDSKVTIIRGPICLTIDKDKLT